MFAIYGFLLGDEPLSQSLNVYHRTIEPSIESGEGWQKRQLLQYLAYDDGYPHCIESSATHTTEFIFKRTKLQVLEMIANHPRYWVVRLPSRRKKPPAFDAEITNQDFDAILQTCRLLAMTHQDYGGYALSILQTVLSQRTLQVFQEKGSNTLELRAWTWMIRLAQHKRKHYHTTLSELNERISNVGAANKERAFAQIQYGEIQCLEYIIDHAHNVVQSVRQDLIDGGEEGEGSSSLMIVREEPCPNSDVLLQLLT